MKNYEEDYVKKKEMSIRISLWGASKANADVVHTFIDDMEAGLNVGGDKGHRSPSRLITLFCRMSTLAYLVEALYGKKKKLVDLSEKEILVLFQKLRAGTLKGKSGRRYKDVGTYARTFKQFWHWYCKSQRKAGKTLPDLVLDLDGTTRSKGDFVYFTKEDMESIGDLCDAWYKTFLWFAFDTGARPKELLGVKVNDISFSKKGTQAHIRVHKKKSFARKVNLVLSAKLVKKHIVREQLDDEDFLFLKDGASINKYLKERAVKALGNKRSLGRAKPSAFSMYDIRHSSVCYFVKKYKKVTGESGLMYRYGWKKPDMIFYYSEFIGFNDTITEQDLLTPEDIKSTEDALSAEKERTAVLEEQMRLMQDRMQEIADMIELKTLYSKQ